MDIEGNVPADWGVGAPLPLSELGHRAVVVALLIVHCSGCSCRHCPSCEGPNKSKAVCTDMASPENMSANADVEAAQRSPLNNEVSSIDS